MIKAERSDSVRALGGNVDLRLAMVTNAQGIIGATIESLFTGYLRVNIKFKGDDGQLVFVEGVPWAHSVGLFEHTMPGENDLVVIACLGGGGYTAGNTVVLGRFNPAKTASKEKAQQSATTIPEVVIGGN